MNRLFRIQPRPSDMTPAGTPPGPTSDAEHGSCSAAVTNGSGVGGSVPSRSSRGHTGRTGGHLAAEAEAARVLHRDDLTSDLPTSTVRPFDPVSHATSNVLVVTAAVAKSDDRVPVSQRMPFRGRMKWDKAFTRATSKGRPTESEDVGGVGIQPRPPPHTPKPCRREHHHDLPRPVSAT